MAMAMQGSGISAVDTASVGIKVNDDGFYSLLIGASDMGTGVTRFVTDGSRTVWTVRWMRLLCMEWIQILLLMNTGSYASSTTYVTGWQSYVPVKH